MQNEAYESVSHRPMPAHCAVRLAVAVLCKRWKAPIVWQLFRGPCRFGKLAGLLPGVSAKVLSEQLHDLVRDGIVRYVNGPPRRGTYSLSPAGKELARIINHFAHWGTSYHKRFPETAARYGLARCVPGPNAVPSAAKAAKLRAATGSIADDAVLCDVQE